MKVWTVGKNEAGLRLDKYIVSKLGFSGQNVKRLLDTGKVRVNGKRVVIAKWEALEGDEVVVNIGGLNAIKEPHTTDKFLEVLYEDRDIIVVNKPAGVVVLAEHDTRSPGRSLVDMTREYLKKRHKGARGAFVHAVHRLDKDTTGVVVLAKSRAGADLEKQFRCHEVLKDYLAVVEGQVEGDGKVNLPIGKGDFGHGRKASVVSPGEGAFAETEYSVRERYRAATLVAVRMKTGRTHQIRIHMSAIGHPLVGDKVYGPHGKISFPRQALHAERIVFRHPSREGRMEFKSPLPKDMEGLIDSLRQDV